MYNPHGYKPLDPHLPHMWRYKIDKTECFYGRCEKLQIPLLVHCSPGGMTTHEAIFYHQLDGVDLSTIPARTTIGYDPRSPVGYFYDNYVHPRNWRPVLAKFPKLRICLAHFGGDEWANTGLKSDWIEEIASLTKDYDNVYTDMSCFDLQEENEKKSFVEFFKLLRNGEKKYLHLRDKVMFGSDWFLTLLLGDPQDILRPTDYIKYCKLFYETLKKEANYKYQWYRMSLVNPVEFYGLGNVDVLSNIKGALGKGKDINIKEINEPIEYGFNRISALKDQAAKIKAALANL